MPERLLDSALLGFRPMLRDDLPLLKRWLNTPHVRQWWQDEPVELDGITEKWSPLLDGTDKTSPFIILYDGSPIGYIQTYRIVDYPDYAQCMSLDEDAGAIDLFIGESEFVHRGLGLEILGKCLREEIFGRMACGIGIIAPQPRNLSAIRCYEKAGFNYLKTIHVSEQPEPEYVMRITPTQIVTTRPLNFNEGVTG